MSSPPPASPPMVWPPSNPSGTVIPFPLPWGQTGCCPPGGLDALMKCYCDIQQASAFIGQIMLDQINNNPAIIAAIIAGIEKSGSNLPLLGVTNGSEAQPGQVGEFIKYEVTIAFPTGSASQPITMGVLPPGDWDVWSYANVDEGLTSIGWNTNPTPAGFADQLLAGLGITGTEWLAMVVSNTTQATTSVPSLIAFTVLSTASTAGALGIVFCARRRR